MDSSNRARKAPPVELRVLLVSGNPSETEPLRQAFQRAGYEARLDIVTTFPQLRKRITVPPDCIVMDGAMPNLDLSRVLRCLRRQRLEIPVAVISDHAVAQSATVTHDYPSLCFLPRGELWTLPLTLGHELRFARERMQRADTERMLRLAQERFELAMRGGNDGLWDLNLETGACYWGPRYREILGFAETQAPLAREDFMGHVHPEDREGLRELLTMHSETGEPFSVEYRFRGGDGVYRWLHDRGTVVRAPDGHAVRMVGFVTEVTRRHMMVEALRESEARERDAAERLQTIFDQTTVGVATTDTDMRYLQVNRRLAEMLGYAPEEMAGRRVSEFTYPDDWPVSVTGISTLDGERERTVKYEKRYLHRDGTVIWAEVGVSVIRDQAGRPQSYLAVVENITERKRQSLLLDSEKRVFERLARGLDSEPILEEVAKLWERHSTQYARCAILLASEDGARLSVAAAPSLPAGFIERVGDTVIRADSNPWGVAACDRAPVIVEDLLADPRWNALHEDMRALGLRGTWSQPILDAHGGVLGAFAVYSASPALPGEPELRLMERLAHLASIIIEKYRAQSTIEHLAQYDALTNLPNRALLLDSLRQALKHDGGRGLQTALLLINLDGMQHVNETVGHGFGDSLLKAMAGRLLDRLQDDAMLSRIGSDEFAIRLQGVRDDSTLPSRVQSILDAIAEPIVIDGREIFVTASLGAGLAPRDGTDADTLFRKADIALRRAKSLGGNGFRFYAEGMNASAANRLEFMNQLRHALERNEFQVHYQPKVDLETQRITGAEALLRWQHPVMGMISPAQFVPFLEETGLIIPVGEWVLSRVCEDLARLDRLGQRVPHVAVNLSPRQFRQPSLAQDVQVTLQRHGLDPGRLMVEITESLIMQEPDQSNRILRQLKETGMRIALDDFGTGYSSLSYLKTFPIDVLKMDKSFMDGVADDPVDGAIAEAIIHMAHSLDMKVVAEGVESSRQLDFLKRLHCDEVQGYLFSRPVVSEVFQSLFTAGMSGPAGLSPAEAP